MGLFARMAGAVTEWGMGRYIGEAWSDAAGRPAASDPGPGPDDGDIYPASLVAGPDGNPAESGVDVGGERQGDGEEHRLDSLYRLSQG